MTLDFACMLYLKLSKDDSIPKDQVKHYVQKWFVLTTLTGRYVGSPESAMSRDIRLIKEKEIRMAEKGVLIRNAFAKNFLTCIVLL